jgi:hypothetical protein
MMNAFRTKALLLTSIFSLFAVAVNSNPAMAYSQELTVALNGAVARGVLAGDTGARLMGAVLGREAAAGITGVAARRASLEEALALEANAAVRESVISAIAALGAPGAQTNTILTRLEAKTAQLRANAQTAAAGREGTIAVAGLITEPVAGANLAQVIPGYSEVNVVLTARLARGEVTAAQVAGYEAGMRAAAAAGETAIIGSGAAACLQRFSAPAVGNYLTFVGAYAGARNLAAMWVQKVERMAQVFGRDFAAAARNACGLTEGAPGSSCQVFGRAFAASCR